MMVTLGRDLLYVTVFSSVLLLKGLGMCAELDTLAFYRATEDKVKFTQNPATYEPRLVKDATGTREYYIERRPVHIVSKVAVQAIVVRKTESKEYEHVPSKAGKSIDKNSGTQVKGKGKVTSRDAGDFAYNVTFRIRYDEGKRLASFNDSHLGQSFDVKVSGRSIGVVQFEWPYDANISNHVEFTIFPSERDITKLKEVLSPFSERTTWE